MFIMYTKTKEVIAVGYTINIKISNYASFLMKDEKRIKINVFVNHANYLQK